MWVENRNLAFVATVNYEVLEKKYLGSTEISYVLSTKHESGQERRGSTYSCVTFFLYMQLCDISKPQTQEGKVSRFC